MVLPKDFFSGKTRDTNTLQTHASNLEMFKKKRRVYVSGGAAPKITQSIRVPVSQRVLDNSTMQRKITTKLEKMIACDMVMEQGASFEHDTAIENAVRDMKTLHEWMQTGWLEDTDGALASKWFRELPQPMKDSLRLCTPGNIDKYEHTGYKLSPLMGQYFVHAGGGITRLIKNSNSTDNWIDCACGQKHQPRT